MAIFNLTSLFKDKIDLKELAKEATGVTSILQDARFSNIYEAYITREAPSSNESISDKISAITITSESMELEEIKVGSAYFNIFKSITGAMLSITFIEDDNSTVMNMLTKKSDLIKPILPTDGTFLLPKDFYFYIEIYALKKKGYYKPKNSTSDEYGSILLLKGEMLLEGSIQTEMATGDSQHQKITATFKPMSNRNIVYSE